MGIRMHLSVGWGLELSKHPNLDPAKMNWRNLEDKDLFEKWKSDVLGFCKQNTGETMEKMVFETPKGMPNSKALKYCADIAVYDSEFGDPDKLLLLPAMSRKEFTRYGDLLDIFTLEAESSGPVDMTPQWTEKPGTLYPYINLMKANPNEPLGVEKYWVSCYFDDPRHKDIIAWAPWHIWFWLRTVFNLTDVETTHAFLSLRPTVYRYWG